MLTFLSRYNERFQATFTVDNRLLERAPFRLTGDDVGGAVGEREGDGLPWEIRALIDAPDAVPVKVAGTRLSLSVRDTALFRRSFGATSALPTGDNILPSIVLERDTGVVLFWTATFWMLSLATLESFEWLRAGVLTRARPLDARPLIEESVDSVAVDEMETL